LTRLACGCLQPRQPAQPFVTEHRAVRDEVLAYSSGTVRDDIAIVALRVPG